MNATSRQTRAVVIVTAAFSLSLACKLEPTTPELKYSLNDAALEENEILVNDAVGKARLKGALEYLFGTPQGPGFLQLPAWEEEEFYPNSIGYDLVSFDEEWGDRWVESNRETYAHQLAAIASATTAEEFAAILVPRYSEDLGRKWENHLEEMPGEGPDGVLFTDDDGNEVSWRQEADYLWSHYYPTLASSARMYRTECFHCHGAEGGGNGSTAPYLSPPPRDYRPGKFKHIPLKDKSRPRQQDLFRILSEGLYTSAMPSFRRFSDAQLHGLADYVRLLSVRGETELLLITDYDPDEGGLTPALMEETYTFVMDRWRAADEKLIEYEGEIPERTAERVAHGRYLFTTPGEQGGANCVSCHGSLGRGDGASAKEINADTGEAQWVKDEWGDPIKPRNLALGVFRLGRRPIDLYRRVYAGINGTPMPEHFGMEIVDQDGTKRTLNEDDVWDLVFFVQSLSSHDKVEHAPSGAGAEHGEERSGH